MPIANINGLDLYYEVHGQGQPLVMIMGLGANLDWWDDYIVQRLSHRFQVVLFDNRGSGRSGKPRGPYSVPQMARDTVGLMDHLALGRAHVLGASMGGMIAQAVAIGFPDRVDRLIVACTGCGGPHLVWPSPGVIWRLLVRRTATAAQRRRQAQLLFPPAFINENSAWLERMWERIIRHPTPPRAYWSQLLAILRYSSYLDLPHIQAPVLIMTGDQDVLVPPCNSEILAAGIPNSRLQIFPGGGHGFPSQFPREFSQAVEEFLLDQR